MVAVDTTENIKDQEKNYVAGGASESNSMGIFSTEYGKRKRQIPPFRGPPSIAMYSIYDYVRGETPQKNDGEIKLLDIFFGAPHENKNIPIELQFLTGQWIEPNILGKSTDGKIYRVGNTREENVVGSIPY